MGGFRGFCDWVSLIFKKYRGLSGSPFDRGGLDGGGFVLRGFGAEVAYEGFDEVEHY